MSRPGSRFVPPELWQPTSVGCDFILISRGSRVPSTATRVMGRLGTSVHKNSKLRRSGIFLRRDSMSPLTGLGSVCWMMDYKDASPTGFALRLGVLATLR